MEPKCETEGDDNPFSLTREETQSAETKQLKGAEVDDQEEREREASRPFYRFVFLIFIEAERLFETMATPLDFRISPKDPSEVPEEGLQEYYQALGPEIRKKRSQPPPDIDRQAYWRVKRKWQNRGIWDDAWPMMPDFSWKHERPLEDLIREAGLEEPSKPGSPKGADSPGSTRV